MDELINGAAPAATEEEADRFAVKLAEIVAADPVRSSLTVFEVGMTGSKANLFRVAAADCEPDDVIETIRRDHGPGNYEIWGKLGQMIKFRVPVRIGAPANAPRPLRTLNAQDPPPSRDGDPFRVLAEAMQNQTKMLERLLTRESERQPQKSAVETLQELAVVRDLFQPPQTRGVLSQFEDLIKLKELLRENDQPPDALTAGIQTLAPLFARALDHVQQSGAPAGRMARARAQLAPPQAAAPESPEMFVQMVLRQYVPDLLRRAAEGEQPDVTAQAIADTISSLPEQAAETVLVWLDAEDAAQKIIALAPAAAPHAAWLDAVLDAMFALLAAESAADLEPPADVPRGTNTSEARATAHSEPAKGAPPPAEGTAGGGGNGAEAVHSVNSGRNRKAKRSPDEQQAGAGGIPT